MSRRLWFLKRRWRKWTALPGDRFWDIERDIVWIIHSGCPGRLRAYPVTGQFIAYYGIEAAVPPVARLEALPARVL